MAPWGQLVGGNTSILIGTSSPPVTLQAPVASINVNTLTGPWPLTVTISDVSTQANNLSEAYYSFGDGTPTKPWVAGETFSHVYETAGTYTLTLRLTNSAGTSVNSKTITTVNVAAPVVDLVVTDVSIVAGVSKTVSFSITATGGPINQARLYFDANTSIPVTLNVGGPPTVVQHTYTAVGTYTARVVAEGPQSSGSDSETVVFDGPPVPSLFWELIPAYSGTTIRVTNTTTGSYTSAVVDFGDNTPTQSITAGGVLEHVYALSYAGLPVQVRIKATGPGGTSEWQSYTVTLPAYLAPQVSLTVEPVVAPTYNGARLKITTSLTGAMASATLNKGFGDLIILSVPSDPTSSVASVTSREIDYPANQDGTVDNYTITLSAQGFTGPAVTQSQQWSIPGIPAPTANFTPSIQATLPDGRTPVTFQFNPSGNITSYSFNPGFGTPITSGVASGSYTVYYPASGTFTATYTVTGPGGQSTPAQQPIVINSANPVVSFTLDRASAAPTSPTSTVSVTLTNTTQLFNNASATYSINWGDGQTESLTSFTTKTHNYSGVPSGDKTIVVTATGSGGGSHSAQRVFTVIKIAPQVSNFVVTENAPYNSQTGLTVTATFNNNGSEITSQSINWGDGGSSQSITVGQTSIQKTYPVGSYGTKTVTLTSINTSTQYQDIDTDTVTGLPTSPPITVSPSYIDFSVINGAQSDITNEPVSVSIPLLEADNLLNTSTLSVYDATNVAIPAQFKVLSRWHGLRSDTSKAIKMVQATFLATVGASPASGVGAQSAYRLRINDTAQVAGSMTVVETATAFSIRPGDGSIMDISKGKFTLLTGAWLNNGAQQIFSNPTSADIGLSFMSKSGRNPNFVAPVPTNVSTVLEEGVVGSGNVKVVIRQTINLTVGARIVCRWTFVHKQPEAQIEFTLRNPQKFHDASAQEGAQTESSTQWHTNVEPRLIDKYVEFIKYMKLGCLMRTTSFPTVQVGSFVSAAKDWRQRSVSYTTVDAGNNYSLQQYFRNRKNTSDIETTDLAEYASGDPNQGNLLFYKEGLFGAHQLYQGRPNGTEAITSKVGTGPITPASVSGTVSNVAGTNPWTATLTNTDTTNLSVGMYIDATPGTGRLGGNGKRITAILSPTSLTYITDSGTQSPAAGTVTHLANPPFASDGESGKYPGGWVVRNGTGLGFILTADSFAERAPKRFEVDKDSGVVRFHVFPEALPNDSMYFDRGNRLGVFAVGNVGRPHLGLIEGVTPQIAQYIYPSGTNPMTGLAYRTGDFVPSTYPDRGPVIPAEPKPTTAGTTLGQLSPNGAWMWYTAPNNPANGFWGMRGTTTGARCEPTVSGHPDADEAYPIFGGSWIIQRLRLRLFNTAPSDAEFKRRVDVTNNPPVGLAATDRYATPGTLMPMPWGPRPTPGQSWDIDRAERFMQGMVDTGSSDIIRINELVYYGTLRTYIDVGGAQPGVKTNHNSVRAVGWDNWGDIWGGSRNGWTNLSYDTPRWTLLQFIRSKDYRHYSLSKRLVDWQMTRGFVKTADGSTYAAGYPYWEAGIGSHGTGKEPASSHAWLGGLTTAYGLTGNEHIVDSLLYCVPALATSVVRANSRNPGLWGRYNDEGNLTGERVWAHGMHDAMFIYTVLGPLNAFDVASQVYESAYATIPADKNTQNKTLLQVIRDGFQNYDDIQAGVRKVRRHVGFCPSPFKTASVPANFIPTSVTNALTQVDTSNYSTSSTYLSGAADTAFLKSSGSITVTGTTQTNTTQTFSISGRDYSDNGFVMLYGSSGPAWMLKSFMFLYCMEAMYMLTVVDPTGPHTVRAKTLLRKAVNFWKTHFLVRHGAVGTIYNVAYLSGTSDRVAAVFANNPTTSSPTPTFGNNWLAEASTWLPAGSATPQGASFNTLDSMYLNITAIALGMLLSKDEPTHAADYADDIEKFKTVYRSCIRFATPSDTAPYLIGRAVGYSKSTDPSISPYTSAGVPRAMYSATGFTPTQYVPTVGSNVAAMSPSNHIYIAQENVTKSLGQSVYRGIIYAAKAASDAGIVGDI